MVLFERVPLEIFRLVLSRFVRFLFGGFRFAVALFGVFVRCPYPEQPANSLMTVVLDACHVDLVLFVLLGAAAGLAEVVYLLVMFLSTRCRKTESANDSTTMAGLDSEDVKPGASPPVAALVGAQVRVSFKLAHLTVLVLIQGFDLVMDVLSYASITARLNDRYPCANFADGDLFPKVLNVGGYTGAFVAAKPEVALPLPLSFLTPMIPLCLFQHMSFDSGPASFDVILTPT